MQMPMDLQQLMDMATKQAASISKPIKITWKVKKCGTTEELTEFLNDGKSILSLQSFVFDNQIIVVYGIGEK